MIIKSLKLLNYRSYKEANILLDKPAYMIIGDIVGTSKSNGSGKSSIFEAIFYALEGDAFFSPSGGKSGKLKNDDLIHNDEKEMSVSVGLEVDGLEYTITRSVIRGKSPTILVITDNANEEKYQVKAGQEIIDNIIGVSAEVLLTTCYFKQGQLDTFSKLSPKDAKELILNILQIDEYTRYENIAKDKVKELNKELNDLDSKESLLITQISSEQNKKTESKYTQKHVDSLEAKLADIKLSDNLEKMLQITKDEYLSIPKNKISDIKKEYNTKEAEISEQLNRIKKLKRLIGKDAVCPTCESCVNQEEMDNIIKILDKECSDNKKQLNGIQGLINTLEELYLEILNISVAVENKYTTHDISRKLSEVQLDLQVQSINKDRISSLKKDIETIKKSKISIEKDLVKYNKLQVAFGKKGIQVYIVDNAIPEIQATANSILKELDSPIQLSIKSQKDLKSGGKAETFDISVFTRFGERSYMTCSGGEKTFIDFALRIALSILLSRRLNFNIQTLILDEVWGELDPVNRLQAAKVLEVVGRKFDFKRILVISHQEELKDNFTNIIRVQKEGTESRILT